MSAKTRARRTYESGDTVSENSQCVSRQKRHRPVSEEQTMAALLPISRFLSLVAITYQCQYRTHLPQTRYSGQTSRVISLGLVPWNPLRPEMKTEYDCINTDRQAHLICCKPSDSMPPGALRRVRRPALAIDDVRLFPIRRIRGIAYRLRATIHRNHGPESVDRHWSIAEQQGKIALRNHYWIMVLPPLESRGRLIS